MLHQPYKINNNIKSTFATLNITPTTINLSSINLSQDSFQMNPCLRPLRHHTIGHENIDMVFDTAQPSDHIQVALLSILLNNNLIKSLLLWGIET